MSVCLSVCPLVSVPVTMADEEEEVEEDVMCPPGKPRALDGALDPYWLIKNPLTTYYNKRV